MGAMKNIPSSCPVAVMLRKGMFHVDSSYLVGQVEFFVAKFQLQDTGSLQSFSYSLKSYLSKTVTSRSNAQYSFPQMLSAAGVAAGTHPFLSLTPPQLRQSVVKALGNSFY